MNIKNIFVSDIKRFTMKFCELSMYEIFQFEDGGNIGIRTEEGFLRLNQMVKVTVTAAHSPMIWNAPVRRLKMTLTPEDE